MPLLLSRCCCRCALSDGPGFYATSALHNTAPQDLHAALVQVEALVPGEVNFVEGHPAHITTSQLPVGVDVLVKAFEREVESLGFLGLISDARVRLSSKPAPEGRPHTAAAVLTAVLTAVPTALLTALLAALLTAVLMTAVLTTVCPPY